MAKSKIIIYLSFCLSLTGLISSVQAQNNQRLPINCDTDFWTITADGYIQQWSLINGSVGGGDTILSGGGISLSYCGDINAPTFYTNSYSPIGISYWDDDLA